MSKRNLDAGMRHAVCMSLTYRTRVSVQPYTPWVYRVSTR